MQGPPHPWERAAHPDRRGRSRPARESAQRVPRQRRARDDGRYHRGQPPARQYEDQGYRGGRYSWRESAGRDGAVGSDAGTVYGGRATAAAGDRRGRGTPAAGDHPRRTRRNPRWAVVTLAVGAVLMLFSGGTALAGVILLDRYASSVQEENLLGSAAVDPGQTLDGPINILLLGLDGRSSGTDDTRSDTIIVLHVPSTHDQAYLISVPRDSWVSVPGYWDMKITEAFFHGHQEGGWTGGAQLVAQSLHQLTGLQFNAAAIVNFNGFEKIIDEMGGIDFCVEVSATSEHIVLVNGEHMGIGQARREGHFYERVRYEIGCQHLVGWQALDYVRQRKNLETEEGDYARQRHQQQLLMAMASKATSADVVTNLGTLDRLLRATGEALILDTNQASLHDFAFTMRGIRPGDLVSLRTNEGWYNSVNIEGVSAEALSEQSVAMFRAAANDTMGQFVLAYPEVVNSD
jgi:LCP family protein required for cell wall assembly